MQTMRISSKWVVAILPLLVAFPAIGDESEKPADVAEEKPAAPEEKPAAAKLLTWHRSLEPAIEEARRRKTSILVRVGAEWCGWCRRLNKEIVLPDVQQELAKWTLVQLDADNDPDDVHRLGVGPIPALRILNSAGRSIRSRDGYLPGATLLLWLRGEDEEAPAEAAPREMAEEVREVPELVASTLPTLVQLLAHRDANVREAVARRLSANRGLAGPEVAKVFAQGNLAARLAALDLLLDWQAPVKDLDPWQPQTITADRLSTLEEWVAKLPTETEESPAVEPLTEQQLTEARAEVAKIMAADVVEMEAIGARLTRYGARLLPTVRQQRLQATTDQARERLDWLRYRLVASDALMFKWPGGLAKLAATDAKPRHAAASELPEVVTNGDESLLIELFGHPDPFVRELSLKALHGVGGQRASSELTRLLADPEPNVRAAVLKQMAENPSAKLVPQVAEYIARETDPDLIVHAVRLLRVVKTREAVECLMKLFPDSSWQVRAEAVEAVGEILSPRNHSPGTKIDASVTADAYTAILELLNDADGFVVSRAISSLSGSDLAMAAAPLAKTAENHPELAEVVAGALTSGSALQNKARPILKGWLNHAHENLRAAAIKAVVDLDGETQLVPALSDPSEKVRIAAAHQVLVICEAGRPSFERSGSGEVLSGSVAPAPAYEEPPTTVLGHAAKAIGSLFQPRSKPPVPVAPTAAKPKKGGRHVHLDPDVIVPVPPEVANSKTEEPEPTDESMTEQETQPYENWLIGIRGGEGREEWMKSTIAPLKTMFESQSAQERLAAGQALVALGDDEGVAAKLIQLAADNPALALPVATILRWLPWNDRVQTFKQLRPLLSGPEPTAHLCDELVILRDIRAGELLWEVLSETEMSVGLAQSLMGNLLHIHGIEMQYGHYIDTDKPQKPIAFDAEAVKKIATQSEHEWQRRMALVLLLQFDEPRAMEAALVIMADEKAPVSLRVDGFIVTLRGSESPKDAQQAAVSMLTEGKATFARPAMAYLTLGPGRLQSFADGQFHLPVSTNVVRAMPGNDSNGKELPDGLEVDHVRPYLNNPDGELAASAAYLMAMLKDPSGLDRLIAHWRTGEAHSDGDNPWTGMVYRAIATGNNPRYVPVLQEIYLSLKQEGEGAYNMRDFYWTIRSMTGPEILKLRKQMREEVGMDRLR